MAILLSRVWPSSTRDLRTEHREAGYTTGFDYGIGHTPRRACSGRNRRRRGGRVLGETCGVLGDPCGLAELSRRETDDTLEVRAEFALVREAGTRGDVGEREVAFSQELLRPFDAAGNGVLMGRHPGGRLELPREVVGAEVDGRSHLRQRQVGVEVFVDVLDDGMQLLSRQRAVCPTGRRAECGGDPNQVDSKEVGQGLGGAAIRATLGALFVTDREHRGPELGILYAVERMIDTRAGLSSNASAATRSTTPGSRKMCNVTRANRTTNCSGGRATRAKWWCGQTASSSSKAGVARK